MAQFLDLVIQPLAKKHLADYTKSTKSIGKILIKCGALASRDYVADDDNALFGMFAKKFKLKSNEVLVVAEAVFKSRAHRNQVFKKFNEEPKIKKMMDGPNQMDMKRSIVGGFKCIVDLKK